MKYLTAIKDLIEARMYMCLLGVVICLVGLLSPRRAMDAMKAAVTR
jgi:hypothetical protein